MIRISLTKINSFLTNFFPVLEFLYFFGDLRIEFLISRLLYKKYVHNILNSENYKKEANHKQKLYFVEQGSRTWSKGWSKGFLEQGSMDLKTEAEIIGVCGQLLPPFSTKLWRN